MKAIRTYNDDDLAGITALEDGRLILWWGEGQSDIVILTSDEYGNVEKIEHIGDIEDHPVVHFLTACAMTGDWGESLKMSKDMLVMYNAIRRRARRPSAT